MTKDQFVQWQKHLNLSGAEASRRYRRSGVPDAEARVIGLACAALALGLQPWQDIHPPSTTT